MFDTDGSTASATGDVPVDANGDMDSDDKSRAVCQECHTAGNGQWRTAPTALSFVGKDTLTLCRRMHSSDAGPASSGTSTTMI